MAQYIGVQGVSLPPPQIWFPPTINNLPSVSGTNAVSLPPSESVTIPSGPYMVSPGQYSVLQVNDPITGRFLFYTTATVNQTMYVESDGQNYKITNRTGCAIAAVVNNGGTGYTSAPVVSANAGGSLWLALVGGGIGGIIAATAGSGSGYTLTPVVSIAAPPSPGVQATAVAAVSGGSISGFTIINPGAGYASAPAVLVMPNPGDPNVGQIRNCVAIAVTSYVGQVTTILQNGHGLPLNSVPALSITGGGGTGATATAIMDFTITGYTLSTAGSGYTAPVQIFTTGGVVTSSAAVSNSPMVSTQALIPRQAQIFATVSGSGVSVNNAAPNSGIIDGGLFAAPPSAYVLPGPLTTNTSGGFAVSAVVSLTVGGVNDTVFLTPL